MDYLTITWQFNSYDLYDKTDILNTAAKLLNISPNEIAIDDKIKGFYGYQKKINLGTVIFYQDNLKLDPELGIFSKMIEISGAGCRDMEEREVNLIQFASWIFSSGGTITRFDIAYDDFEAKHCDIFKILDYVKDGHFVGDIKKWKYELGAKNRKYDEIGLTFGKKSSKKQLQIYDKILERKVNYEIDADFIDKWFRYEMRFRKETGHLYFKYYIKILNGEIIKIPNKKDFIVIDNGSVENNIIQFYFSTLLQLLDIKEKSNDMNKSRVKTVDWWKTFCNDFSKIKIRNQNKIESTIVTNKKWIKRSVIKPLTKVASAIGKKNTLDYISLSIDEKEIELSDNDFVKINAYKDSLSETGEVDSWIQELNILDKKN